MARSAAQRARRRALRASRPFFPLTRLPLELQLNVLFRCDPVSFHLLLQMSGHCRALYLQYPETCLQQVFNCLPASLWSLLKTAWALHTTPEVDQDINIGIELFANGKATDDGDIDIRSVFNGENPLLIADGLVELYQEIHVATNLYAQSLDAAMETFVNPWTEIKMATLSPAEYCRVASTVLMLRIFYQLQLKCSHQQDAMSTYRAFLAHLDQWEIEQLAALDEFLKCVRLGTPSDAYYRLNLDHIVLSKKSIYVQRYLQTFESGDTDESPSIISRVLFSGSARSHLRGLPYQQLPRLQTTGTIDEALTLMNAEDVASCRPSRTLGWFLHHCSNPDWSDWKRYQWFVDLGMFFWDHQRLENWCILHQPTYDSMFSKFEDHLSEAFERVPVLPRMPRPLHHYSEEQQAEIIVRWTRSPIPCFVGDWLWQHHALDHYPHSRPIDSPVRYSCYYCLQGQFSYSCYYCHQMLCRFKLEKVNWGYEAVKMY